MEVQWVIGVYTGERAKSVKAHADAGIGYFIREEGGKGAQYRVIAAFKRPMDSPIPPHLDKATPSVATALDRLHDQRHPTNQNLK